MMASFYYYDQDPLGFCFLVQIRAFVIQTSLGLHNLNMKGNKDSGRSSKMTPSCKWPTGSLSVANTIQLLIVGNRIFQIPYSF